MQLVEVNHLTKQFKELRAVDDLSFTVPRGSVYGFLGQNGAGKSTTIRMLLTLIHPSSGSINIFGKNLLQHRNEVLQRTGAIIEKPDLYKYLTALQNLEIMARLSGMRPSRQQLIRQLERVGLADRANSKFKTFSQGMKQRLGIACALIHDPELIILDEPVNGLDPQGIADVRRLILQLSREEGKTLIISSHLLSEMEQVADEMLIIHKGKKVVEGKVADLLNPADTLVTISTTDDRSALHLLQDSQWQKKLLAAKENIQLKMHKNELPELTAYLVHKGIGLMAVQPRHSLEDYFISLTTEQENVVTR